jgi:hypothetical protein
MYRALPAFDHGLRGKESHPGLLGILPGRNRQSETKRGFQYVQRNREIRGRRRKQALQAALPPSAAQAFPGHRLACNFSSDWRDLAGFREQDRPRLHQGSCETRNQRPNGTHFEVLPRDCDSACASPSAPFLEAGRHRGWPAPECLIMDVLRGQQPPFPPFPCPR